MDALPIDEATGLPYASRFPGIMHACGHDGHTAMLLGAARLLARKREFGGTVVLIFQPAEEGQAGAKAMCDDGLMERFAIDRVFALHNEPGLDIGHFATRTGPFAAAVATFRIMIEGKTAHGGSPQAGIDTLLPAANIVMALQTIMGRNIPALKSGVITLGMIQGGKPGNVIASTTELRGLARWFDPDVRDIMHRRIIDVAEGIAASYGASATLRFKTLYPVVVNNAAATLLAVEAARAVFGTDAVNPDHPVLMGSEDFAFMLEKRPGNIALLGNGNTAGLHDPGYDFNDAAIPHGVAYWTKLVEMAMPLTSRK